MDLAVVVVVVDDLLMIPQQPQPTKWQQPLSSVVVVGIPPL
jgi:hypothetical protein